jgi:hypothetical protein
MYPSVAATRRATVLFPDPAGPSIAIVSRVDIISVPDPDHWYLIPEVGKVEAERILLEPHNVVAAVDVQSLAGDARTAFREQKCRG